MLSESEDSTVVEAVQADVAALATTDPAAELIAWLRSVHAIGQMADLYGRRFVLWRNEPNEKGGLDKKPKRLDGRTSASSTDDTTWNTLERCCAALPHAPVGTGLGVILAAERDAANGVLILVGVDLDGCRDPETGVIKPWALKVIRVLDSYTEVSPSSTGVKIYLLVERDPELPANKLVIAKAVNGGKAEQIEIFKTGRYFALTGQHLPGTPTKLQVRTEAFAALAAEAGKGKKAKRGHAEVDTGGMSAELAELIKGDPKLAESWATGRKLTKGGDDTTSGLDWSHALYLGRRGVPEALVEEAVRLYPHSQIANGKVADVERRVAQLLEAATEARKGKASWYAGLIGDPPTPCLANAAAILRKAPEFAGRIRFDELLVAAVCRDLPWSPDGDWRPWTDRDDLCLAEWCQVGGVPLKAGTCAEAVAVVAGENPFHPVREYLDGLTWDGTERLDGWLATYLDVTAGNPAYVRAVGRCWMISAVARAYKPGCKADHVLILEGPQGARKSSALATLVPVEAWFTDQIAEFGTKDSGQDLAGKWIIEIAELDAMGRKEVETTKAFLSRKTDHYRPSYGRRSQDFSRQCVFAGTTNADFYLKDETGNRRSWGIKVGRIDLDALERDRDQLWAEAVRAYNAGKGWWLAEDVERLAAVEQAGRRTVDPWEEQVLALAERETVKVYDKALQRTVDVPAPPVTVSGLLVGLGVPVDRQGQADANRVVRILKARGWEKYQVRKGDERFWAYRKPAA